MPWDRVKLNDGSTIPSIGFGTWKLGNGQAVVDQVEQAISVGFSHIDTAQLYENEAEGGIAIRESGLARDEIFITTKFVGLGGRDIPTSIRDSLKYLGVAYVDLYLIHHPRAVSDIPKAWKQMEELKKEGLAKSIGVSNFSVQDLELLLASAEIKPAVNQILLHPYVYGTQAPIVAFSHKHNIAIEAFSCLIPLTELPGGPLDVPLNSIAERLKVQTNQVLLAWAKAKGAIVLTTSSKKYRLEGYLNASDLALTSEDIAALDEAGAAGYASKLVTAKTIARRLAYVGISAGMTYQALKYFGVDFL